MARNAPCLLLNDEENNQLFGLLGRSCTSMASAVVQLYEADSASSRWTLAHSGIVCFVKDGAYKSYFIRLYDVTARRMVWEQEMYTRFKYKTPKDFFHTFEGDTAMVGVNFASEDEACKFRDAVLTRLRERDRRKEMRKEEIRRRKQDPGNVAPPTPPSPMHNVDLPARSPPATSAPGKVKDKDKKGKKISKSDIGTPADFRVVSRLGWNPEKGFDFYNLDPVMMEVFKAVGINSNEEANPATVEFIYDFVEKNGGLDVIRQELSGRTAPPPPTGPPPSVPPRPGADSRAPEPENAPPLPPHRPSTRRRPPQPPPSTPNRGPPPSPPSHTSSSPAIPPPPPIPTAPPAPPMPPPGSQSSSAGRAPLTPAKPPSTPAKTPAPAPVEGRDALLSQIQVGIKLKKVEVDDTLKPAAGAGGILGTLQEALNKNRHKLATPIDDDSEEDGSDVDEWSE